LISAPTPIGQKVTMRRVWAITEAIDTPPNRKMPIKRVRF